ncbi:hypothetical protein QE152_g7988 [Popillia japonica]|uniref:Uncharacterized protein n=1 Tax=Popillia japonica TaxID=7064 RepID=A0AAW1MBI5_POPJA
MNVVHIRNTNRIAQGAKKANKKAKGRHFTFNNEMNELNMKLWEEQHLFKTHIFKDSDFIASNVFIFKDSDFIASNVFKNRDTLLNNESSDDDVPLAIIQRRLQAFKGNFSIAGSHTKYFHRKKNRHTESCRTNQ